VQAPRLKLAKPLILGLARASQGLSRLRTKPSLLSVDGVKALMNPQELSSAKAQKILHAKFRPLEVTLKDTLEWYKGHGYLSS
ncbi:MAG: hypothetical protein KC422_10025, partial [Trueperaceae bacterium]|nr:hypothetical protein [Trueperaceae bacterium]